jgi:threonylcarbamoyladenosine tRNA methylthiotransferase MtaB
MAIDTFSFGCRLNTLECEKIASMLAPHFTSAIIVNTCSVTAEAERQCAQFVRKLNRENPDTPIFITGCGATRAPEKFAGTVIRNTDKLNLQAYKPTAVVKTSENTIAPQTKSKLSKAFIQVQNGCNHQCTYCITRLLRGKNVSFPYDTILQDVHLAIKNGFYEIVLTGIDIASYIGLADLCKNLLNDVPEIKRLRLSSLDPASIEIPKIIELIHQNKRMLPHLHLSLQSGSDTILQAMQRRHNAKMVKGLFATHPEITTSWDIICGFPGETDELFEQTCDLARELKPIKIHAFPFSPRPGTVAATMPNHIPRDISKKRVKIITDIRNAARHEYMDMQIGKTVQILMEENNIARGADEIDIKVIGAVIPRRTICNIEIIGCEQDHFIGKVAL